MTCDCWNFLPPTVRPVIGCFFIFAIAVPIALLAMVPILQAWDFSRRTSSLSRLSLLEIYLLDFLFLKTLCQECFLLGIWYAFGFALPPPGPSASESSGHELSSCLQFEARLVQYPSSILVFAVWNTFLGSTLAASLLRGLCFWPSCQIHRQYSSREWLDVYSLRCTISLALPCLLLLTAQLQARPWSLRVDGKKIESEVIKYGKSQAMPAPRAALRAALFFF